MASAKNLELKKAVVDEIKSKLENNKTFLLLNYQGLTDQEAKELRKGLKGCDSEIKIYKNTLVELALKDKNIELSEYTTGPNAYLFSKNIIEPIKFVSEFIKNHPSLEFKVGYIDNEIASKEVIDTYASIPSMEGLLNMFASGLMEHVRNFSIALNLYKENLEKNEGGEK